MKLIKSMLALAAALSISYLPASVSANDNISVQNTSNLSILIPKNIDMGNADSASFSVQAKGKLNDIDIVTVSADKEVAMKRAGDEYYLNTATVDFSAQWRGSDLNPDTYIEKTGTITFSEKKVGTYTGKLNFTVTHKETFNISYDSVGGVMPVEYPTYYFSDEGLDSLPVPTKDNSKFLGWGETIEYTLGDYWEIGEGGSLLVSDKYAGANSGPQPKAPEIAGVKPLYRGITFSVESEAMLSFSFDYERNISEVTSTEGGGKFYLYKDETLIDEFTPSGTGELIKGTMDYSRNLEAGNYQIIFEGYVELIGMKQGVTETVRDFNVVSQPVLNSIPKGTSGNLNLTAVWESAVTYSISYDPAGGTMPDEYQTYYYSEEGLDPLPVPTKAGYTFTGWSEITPYEVDPSSEWTENNGVFTHDGEKQLVINFEIFNPAALSFDFVNQSRMPVWEYPYYSIYKDGSLVTGQSLMSTGYVYNISHELESGSYQLIISSGSPSECEVSNIKIAGEAITSIPVGSTGDLNLTAQWEPAETYSITYDTAGGTLPAEYPTEYTSDRRVILPDALKEGYRFIGWHDADSGETIQSIEAGTSGNRHLTAVWEKIELSTVLETGARFSENIPEGVTNILFTDEIAPEGIEAVDVSAAQDKGIVAWLDSTTWKVSTQRKGIHIIANENSSRLFENAASLTSIDGLENIDFSSVVYAEYMFNGCASLISIPLEEMDLSNVQYASYMFKDCQSLDGIMTLNLPKVGNSETGWHIIGMFEGASINEGSILLVTGDDDSFTSAAVSTRTEPESKNYGVYLKIKDSYFTVEPESLEGVLENDSPAKITVTFSLKYGSLLYCYDPNDIHIGIQVESTDSEVILIDGADFWMIQEGVAAIVGTVTDADGTEYVRSCEITVTKG
ncbi:InlB B-repeat-containing protein [Traorella massiliensis]|uniref:InlB B-repeat-containing protein n=1 Tax=Traorella massiliensis TaxID=1903263 RepID=UPI0008F83843|nr:InlB B-repeat-containing protein [Traorella massiliensis]